MPIFYTKNMNKVYTKQRILVFFWKKPKKTLQSGAEKDEKTRNLWRKNLKNAIFYATWTKNIFIFVQISINERNEFFKKYWHFTCFSV